MLLFCFSHQCLIIEVNILDSSLEVSNFPHERALNLWNPNIITFPTHTLIWLLDVLILFIRALLIRYACLRFGSDWNFISLPDIFHLYVGLWILASAAEVSAHGVHLRMLAFPIFRHFLLLITLVRVIKCIVVIEPRAMSPSWSGHRGEALILLVDVISRVL